METAPTPSPDEHERNPDLWIDLIQIENVIKEGLRNIDVSGESGHIARDIVMKRLREKNHWYEKWATATYPEWAKWARVTSANGPKKDQSQFDDLLKTAQENTRLAKKFLAEKDPAKFSNLKQDQNSVEIENPTLEQTYLINLKVENGAIEDSAQRLEQLNKLIKEDRVQDAAREFIKWIQEFKETFIYVDMDENTRKFFDSYGKVLEADIDNVNALHVLLPYYITTLATLLRNRKK